MIILNSKQRLSLASIGLKYRAEVSQLTWLALLTIFFVLLELSLFIQCNKLTLADYVTLTRQINVPWRMLPSILYFISAQLFIHTIYILAIWFIASTYVITFKLNSDQALRVNFAFWFLATLMAITANQLFYPNSLFSELTYHFISDYYARLFLYVGFVCLIVASIGILILALYSLSLRVMTLSSFFAIICLCLIGYSNPSHDTRDAATESQPNIIIIGIDALRPDYLGYNGRDISTPFFDRFMQQATVFQESVTPLARTFPSWTTILTGLHPLQYGMRSDLISQEHFDTSKTLPTLLKKSGYQTIYATDETRFSNIDTQYGFDVAVTPPIGLSDFLLGSYNDFPLSNLVVNTSLGAKLFPHSYGNRPAHVTYEPDQFLRLVTPYLEKDRTHPFFMAIHFCLPHAPYLWASIAGRDLSALSRYESAVERVDRQVGDFYALLARTHALDHAMVIILSDHGEALELPGDRMTDESAYIDRKKHVPPMFYPPDADIVAVNVSAGHGTDVLSLSQYHTVLAIQLLGIGHQSPGDVLGVVSLMDIKPTILDLVNNQHSDASLLNVIHAMPQISHSKRHIFLESDYSPESIRTVYPETKKVLLESIDLFEINSLTTRLTLRDRMIEMINRSKQLADIYDHWMLALYPQANQDRIPILIDLNTGMWTDNLNSDFAKKSPAKIMLAALKKFYTKEINQLRTYEHNSG